MPNVDAIEIKHKNKHDGNIRLCCGMFTTLLNKE